MDHLIKNIRILCEKYETETNDFIELSLTHFKGEQTKIISFTEKRIKIYINLSDLVKHMQELLIPPEVDIEWLILNINEINGLSGIYSSVDYFNEIIKNKSNIDSNWSNIMLNYRKGTVIFLNDNNHEYPIGCKIGTFEFVK